MFRTVYVGKLLGIKVYIHWTFWLLALYVGFSNIRFGFGPAASAIGFVFAVFGCVFLHEMGHAVAGKWFRIPTLDITLYPIGGAARMGDFTRAPFSELVIAIAGPMVNFAIATALYVGLSIRASLDQLTLDGVGTFDPWEQLFVANTILAIFNMLPAFPLDGGRVLRSALAMWMPFESATRYAARVGQGFGVMMFVVGCVWNWPLVFIGLLVFIACTVELLKAAFIRAASNMSQTPAEYRSNEETVDTVDAVEVRQVL
jgi:Zn-dependent protease